MRDFNYEILDVIQKRWSPRCFSEVAVDLDDLKAIIEAGTYAPSCFNEQPWRFIVATEEVDLNIMRSFLNERNLKWAGKAPVLMLAVAQNVFNHNGKPNAYANFDTGAAWGLLSLEAVTRGYQTHAMAGYDHELARQSLNIPKDYNLIAMIVLGKPGKLETLDESFRKIEKPNSRKSLETFYCDVNLFKGE